MAKIKLANAETDRDVNEFIEAISHKKRKADSLKLLALMKEITGAEPKIWGKSIVAFGKYTAQRKNGDEYDWFHVGFSPARSHITLYLMYDINSVPELLAKLGKHSCGKGCLYIKDLDKANPEALRTIIAKSDRWQS